MPAVFQSSPHKTVGIGLFLQEGERCIPILQSPPVLSGQYPHKSYFKYVWREIQLSSH
jgi:hypothetical protein